MSFLFPTFLWALAALAIPIIIHFFFFRRFKKVYFTNVKFLKEVKEERASRNRLKHLLVLLSRLLALAFLVLAFAQPYIPKGEEEAVKQGKKAVSIYVDNSFSMEAKSDDVSLFEKAKYKAREIIDAYGADDKFQLITNDFEGRHQRLLNKEAFLGLLDEVTITPNVRSLKEVTERQKQVFNNASSDHHNSFIISDFQKNIVNFENDTSINYYFVPLQAVEQHNVFIDSVWFESPIRKLNQSNQLLVRIRNTGENLVEASRLELHINEQAKGLKKVNIPPQSIMVDTFHFTITETGWHKAEMKITDYPISFDDTYFFTFEVAEKINVLGINETGGSSYLSALFNEERYFNFVNQSVNKLDYAKLPKNQLVILNNIRNISSGLADNLQKYLKEGGSILVFPHPQLDMASYDNMLKTLRVNTYSNMNRNEREIDFINTKQEVFDDVFEKTGANLDLPLVKQSFNMTSYSAAGEEVLLKLRGGNSFLGKYRIGDGKLYLCASPLGKEYSNLVSHAIFAPMIYKIALVGSKNTQIAYTIGADSFIETEHKSDKKETVFKLKGEEEEFIPGQKVIGSKLVLNLNNQLKKAGIYQLYKDALQPLDFFGFNFNRRESFLDYLDMDALKKSFSFKNIKFLKENDASLKAEIGQYERGIELWKWCLVLALLFLAIEILLLRLWKR